MRWREKSLIVDEDREISCAALLLALEGYFQRCVLPASETPRRQMRPELRGVEGRSVDPHHVWVVNSDRSASLPLEACEWALGTLMVFVVLR